MSLNTYIYHLDKNNLITHLSKNWESFANENDWNKEHRPHTIVGTNFFKYIHDAETRQLYSDLFKKTRQGHQIGPIPFRCDSPKERRFLNLTLTPLADQGIQLTNKIVKFETRAPMNIWNPKIKRSEQHVRVCSMCKKIALSQDNWVEVEEGLKTLKLFETHPPPQLTHGICPSCFQIAKKELGLL